MSFIIRWLVTSIAVGVAFWIVPGASLFHSGGEMWIAIALLGLILTLVNLCIKPIVVFLSIPLTVLTLGIAYLIVNTALLYLAAWITSGVFAVGIYFSSFGSALMTSIIISVVSAIVGAVLGSD